MARTRRIKRDGDAHYHLMSRTNDRRFLFSRGRVKGEIVSLLRKAAAFSGVRLEAWCVMDNHFHIVCEVVKPDEPVPEAEVIRRIGILKGGRFAIELAEHWSNLRSCGMDFVVAAALNGWRARMHDVSQFTKTFKELVNISYKAFVKTSTESNNPSYCGSIWSGRFKSTLVEGGRYLAACVRYVELNPVRAGMVSQAKNYAYGSANEPKPSEINGFAGSAFGCVGLAASARVPDAALLRRVAQVGNGKIFGGYAFVMRAIFGFGDCFAGHPVPRPVFAGGSQGVSPLEAYASHGWRNAG